MRESGFNPFQNGSGISIDYSTLKVNVSYDATLEVNGSNQLGINLSNANTWTALQTFNNGWQAELSGSDAYVTLASGNTPEYVGIANSASNSDSSYMIIQQSVSPYDVFLSPPSGGTGHLRINNNDAMTWESGGVTFQVIGDFTDGITGTGNTGTLTAGTGILGTANTWTALQTFGNNISLGGAALNVSSLATDQILQYNGTNWVNVALPSSGVTSVSNTDGTLTVSPTTGAVVASLNLGNANTWSADQAISANNTLTIDNNASVDGQLIFATSGAYYTGVEFTNPSLHTYSWLVNYSSSTPQAFEVYDFTSSTNLFNVDGSGNAAVLGHLTAQYIDANVGNDNPNGATPTVVLAIYGHNEGGVIGSGNYGLGISNSTLDFLTASGNYFGWWAGTAQVASLDGSGNLIAAGHIYAGSSGGGVLFSGTSAVNGSGSGGASFSGRPRIGDWGQWLTIGEPNGTNGGAIIQVNGGGSYIGFGTSSGITTSPSIHTKINSSNGSLENYRGISSAGWGLGQIVAQSSGSGTVSTTQNLINYSAPAGLYLVMFQGVVDTSWGIVVTTSSDVSGGSYSPVNVFANVGSGVRDQWTVTVSAGSSGSTISVRFNNSASASAWWNTAIVKMD